MKSYPALILITSSLVTVMNPATGLATVITGNIVDWEKSGSRQTIGDGVNQVQLFWSLNSFHKGWFYGGASYGEVAVATGVTDISQITDASKYTYISGAVGPLNDASANPDGVGDFAVWWNPTTHYYGVLRIDAITVTDINAPLATLDGTWWFQTDGTGNFSPAPEPATLSIAGLGLGCLALRFRRRKRLEIRRRVRTNSAAAG